LPTSAAPPLTTAVEASQSSSLGEAHAPYLQSTKRLTRERSTLLEPGPSILCPS